MFRKSKHSKMLGLERNFTSQDYDNLVKALFETSPPKISHQDIDFPSDDDGLAWASHFKEHRWVFEHFEGFPDHVHNFHAPGESYDCGPWQIERRAAPFISMAGLDDGPIAGIQYNLYYNAHSAGEIEIEPQLGISKLPESYRNAAIHVNVIEAPLLPYEHIRGLLLICTEYFDFLKDREFREDRLYNIQTAISNTLWESNRKNSIWVNLYLYYSGVIDLRKKFIQTRN